MQNFTKYNKLFYFILYFFRGEQERKKNKCLKVNLCSHKRRLIIKKNKKWNKKKRCKIPKQVKKIKNSTTKKKSDILKTGLQMIYQLLVWILVLWEDDAVILIAPCEVFCVLWWCNNLLMFVIFYTCTFRMTFIVYIHIIRMFCLWKSSYGKQWRPY